MINSVPAEDFVVDSFPSALQKEVAIQGRVYLTQNRICFYSNLLSSITSFVIPLAEVDTIQKASESQKNCFVVKTKDTEVRSL